MGTSVEGNTQTGRPVSRPPVIVAGLTAGGVVVPLLVDTSGKLQVA